MSIKEGRYDHHCSFFYMLNNALEINLGTMNRAFNQASQKSILDKSVCVCACLCVEGAKKLSLPQAKVGQESLASTQLPA